MAKMPKPIYHFYVTYEVRCKGGRVLPGYMGIEASTPYFSMEAIEEVRSQVLAAVKPIHPDAESVMLTWWTEIMASGADFEVTRSAYVHEI